MPHTPAKVLDAVRKAPGTRVKVAVSDIDGILRGKYIHKDKFTSAVEGGFGFCDVVFGWDSQDVCYDNTSLTGWHKGYPDALARLDLGTYRTVPWDGDVPFFLGEFVTEENGKQAPHPLCPRQVLKRVLARAEKLGFTPMCGMEFEWFNFAETPQSWAAKKGVGPEPITPGMFGYSLLRANHVAAVPRSAVQRDGRLRRADRGPAYGDGPRRIRGRDPVLRGARGRGSRGPLQDGRQGDRLALRDHAELHGQVEPAVSGLLGAHPPVAVRRQEEPLLRREGPPRHEQALRELSRRARSPWRWSSRRCSGPRSTATSGWSTDSGRR